MKRVVASAPAKVILFGEHFVVRGKPSIAAAIDMRIRVAVREAPPGERPRVRSSFYGESPLDKPLKWARPFKAIIDYLREKGYSVPPLIVEVSGDVKPGNGLGSSAGSLASFSLALSRLIGASTRKEDIIEAAIKGEEIAHGRPSGIDPTIAVYGGILYYRRGHKPRPISGRLGGDLIVAGSGVERSTGEAVRRVLELRDRYPSILDHVYDAAEALVETAVDALERGDIAILGDLMNINHGLLSSVGVSIREIEDIVYEARRLGAIGSKVTGAGLGGSVIALAFEGEGGRIARGLSRMAEFSRTASIDWDGCRLEEE